MKRFVTIVFTVIMTLNVGTFAFAANTGAKSIDINAASEAQIKALPGVGAETAKKIIAGRPYKTKDQLKSKEIVSADLYEQIKKLIDTVC